MFSVKTPAKINLFLNVRPPRADGYHEICTVMQAIALWDELTVEPEPNGSELTFTCSEEGLTTNLQDNLVVKAYQLFWQETELPPLGLRVHLKKGIPSQAGLGGGSSDAAAVLQVLSHLSHAELSTERLQTIAAKLGSDVPFFIEGGLALATGRGDHIQQLPKNLLPSMPLVVVKPRHLPISTAQAYERFRTQNAYEAKNPEHLLQMLARSRQKSIQELEPYLLNDFERVLFPAYPQLQGIAERFKQLGISRPLLSGSGSAMVGFLAHHFNQAEIQKAFAPSDYLLYFIQTHPAGLQQAIPAHKDQ